MPLIVAGCTGAPDIVCVAAVCVFLAVVGVGAALFTLCGTYQSAMNKLLEEDDYTRAQKAQKGVKGAVTTVYWLTVTAVFLFYTFGPMGNGQAKHSWFIWAIGGVLYAAVMAVVGLVLRRKEHK